jgi:hypothetical protein
MTRPRVFHDAGTAVHLDTGVVYDLPVVVAQALVATGAAVRMDDEPPADAPVAAARDMKPPEGRPLAPPERKRESR